MNNNDPIITLEIVQRVSRRAALGLPIDLACAVEGDPRVNACSWEKALKENPDFVVIFQAARADFIEAALRRIIEHGNLSHLRWLLERRHFNRSAPDGEREDNDDEDPKNQTVVGVPNSVLERAREYARQRALEPHTSNGNTNSTTENSRSN